MMCWQDHLRRTLNVLEAYSNPPRIAIVGIGHELRGDDGVGIHIVRELKKCMVSGPDLMLIETGPAPENFCSTLRRFQPNLVIMVDAATHGEEPGSVNWLSWQDADGASMSTHSLPISIFANYLSFELGCSVALLGIQPAGLGFASSLSKSARVAVEEIVTSLVEILNHRFKPDNGLEQVDD